MGQAKQRGTFEQRKTESIIKANKEAIRRKLAYEERERNKTPAQKKDEAKARMLLTSIMSMGMMGYTR